MSLKKVCRSVIFSIVCLVTSVEEGFADNLIVNGTFDSGFSGWSQIAVSGPLSVYISSASNCYSGHSGNPAVTFNVYGNRRSAIEQIVVLPAGGTYTLKLREWGQYQATTVNVIIKDSNSSPTTIATFTAEQMIAGYTPGPVFQCTGASPVQKSFDISSYAGQTITLRIEATSSGFDGTFAMIDDVQIESGVGAGGGGNGGGGDDDQRRPTKISLFCNRSGPTLGTAKCSATVADAGPQPVSLPTGTVDLLATGGFFPGAASCQPQQTPYSPGIGSCETQFQVPSGFPIGVKFPIEATYQGNTTFKPSSTSHDLISAGCVSVPGQTPCPNSVGISFGNFPKLAKDKLSLILGCGFTSSTAKLLQDGHIALAAEKDDASKTGSCSAKVNGAPDFFGFMKAASHDDLVELAKQLPKDSKDDTTLQQIVRDAAKMKEDRFKIMQENDAAIKKLADDMTKDVKAKPLPKNKDLLDRYFYIKEVTFGRAPKVKRAAFETATLVVLANKQKVAKLTLNPSGAKVSKLFKKAKMLLPFKVSAVVTQKGRKGKAVLNSEFIAKP